VRKILESGISLRDNIHEAISTDEVVVKLSLDGPFVHSLYGCAAKLITTHRELQRVFAIQRPTGAWLAECASSK
jgi:hypothetical protein